jgi:hypothetical protein
MAYPTLFQNYQESDAKMPVISIAQIAEGTRYAF